MTQQLDSKEFHFCFKILEKKKHEKQCTQYEGDL